MNEYIISDDFYEWVKGVQDPSLTLKIERKWSSIYTDNRVLLRKDLFKRFGNPELLNLEKIPRNLGQNVSISHCPVYGGYAISDRPLGFDLEQWQRISKPLVKRICDDSEQAMIAKMPDDQAIIWGAKESAYKSLKRNEGQITEIQLISIDKVPSDVEGLAFYKIQSRFQKQTIKGFGFIDHKHDLTGVISYPTTA